MTARQQTKNFTQALGQYKHSIDADIEVYVQHTLSEVHEQFGPYPAEAVEVFVALLKRGGKRIRGALTMNSYYMFGGTDHEVAMQAARAIEMLHAYILMIDDIQDRSDVRRGGPTAHIALQDYHKRKHLKAEALHFGESIAINGSLFGVHSALQILANINVADERRLAAIRNVNAHFITTVHGQTLDIFNEVVETVDENDVDKVLLWKTAYYTFANPLQLGAILAGASKSDLDLLEEFALHAGVQFQITDDIIGVFGKEIETGKSSLDDIREGKRTMLVVKALEMAQKADGYFLNQMLGNQKLTQVELNRCKTIIDESGALDYAHTLASAAATQAIGVLHEVPISWSPQHVTFLIELVNSLKERKS